MGSRLFYTRKQKSAKNRRKVREAGGKNAQNLATS